MKAIFCVLLFAASVFGLVVNKFHQVKTNDLKSLTGSQWKGELKYLDYGSNKQVSIQSNLTVTQSADDKSLWVFQYDYPLEPKANEKINVKISSDGKTFDGGEVIERTNLPNKTLKIVTTERGMDNDKASTFRHIYLINRQSFSIRKEVKYDGATEFFERNEYAWKR